MVYKTDNYSDLHTNYHLLEKHDAKAYFILIE